MEFASIEEIKEYFGINTDDIEEIRKQLKNMLAELHPDKNGGEYRNKKQQKDYEEVSNAITFFDNSSTSLVLPRKHMDKRFAKNRRLNYFQNEK